jgi:hypothetical protein
MGADFSRSCNSIAYYASKEHNLVSHAEKGAFDARLAASSSGSRLPTKSTYCSQTAISGNLSARLQLW